MPTALPLRSTLRRGAYASLALGLLIGAIAIAADTHWWPLAVFAIAPDVALFAGAGTGLQAASSTRAPSRSTTPCTGSSAPRCSPRPRSAASSAARLLVAALAWAFHIALDRAVGTASARARASSVPESLAPRAREIVDAALALLEEEGAEALSMRRLAERVGIRAPSIYKHLADKRRARGGDHLARLRAAGRRLRGGSRRRGRPARRPWRARTASSPLPIRTSTA